MTAKKTEPKTVGERNINQRIAAAMGAVTYVQKDRKNGMKYSIVSHDVVTAKVRPALLEQGVIYRPVALKYTQVGNRTEVMLDVIFINIDDPTDTFTVPSLGFGVDNQDKGPGKAVSYAVKYALLKAMGLETGDDPDHDDMDFKSPSNSYVEICCSLLVSAQNMFDLGNHFVEITHADNFKALADPQKQEIIAAKDKRKAELANNPEHEA